MRLRRHGGADKYVPEKYRLQAKLAVKDDFDFLEMGIEHSEAELEAAIMKRIRAFLVEMGGHYTFVGNQFHIDVAGEGISIDRSQQRVALVFSKMIISIYCVHSPHKNGGIDFSKPLLGDAVITQPPEQRFFKLSGGG